jgi:hypothetical protein
MGPSAIHITPGVVTDLAAGLTTRVSVASPADTISRANMDTAIAVILIYRIMLNLLWANCDWVS